MIRIAIDAMGGDFGPEPIIEGVVDALDEKKFLPILVGNREQIISFLPEFYLDKVEIVESSDVISMSDQATHALKRKESSIFKSVELVRNGQADAVVSAGHSGATMTLATLRIGRLPGISKPALATIMPTIASKTLLLDVGAVTDCTAQNLYEFAIMGEVYAQKVIGLEAPSVGLLSNGEEDSKGNALTKEAFKLMQNVPGFKGNVEGSDIFNASVDVVVCDGYTGNIVLKASEGVVSTVFSLMKTHIKKSIPAKIGAFMMKKKVFKKLKEKVDYAEYGGAPLLGVKGCAIISHGKSNSKAIKNAIFQAITYSESGVNKAIEELLVKNNNA
ncbi:MAG: Phosphate:acyl-ACP acyltransferase PlsX [uncultured Sulfurovum sp.]|uniref:Phosphate acyltransferase n=1 Tax=uncultured Sulfurovum sp. TaxID=269237 RepID=A0A6S6THC0_9BACT|nr:MAG: Phosphate:acyl-ACP acyltransferase PlsX [uncultured Sulfurovum sp.]